MQHQPYIRARHSVNGRPNSPLPQPTISAQAVAYSLHYGNGSRSLARIIPDDRWPGMWRIHWPDDRISDMANLTRAKDAAIAACERGPPRLRDTRLFQWREVRIAPLVAPMENSDPCPTGPRGDYQAQRAARIWRKKRGIILEPGARKQRAKYEAAMTAADQVRP
jgi:hypothetical protein